MKPPYLGASFFWGGAHWCASWALMIMKWYFGSIFRPTLLILWMSWEQD